MSEQTSDPTVSDLPSSMRASVLNPDRTIVLEERPVPTPAADEVLVQIEAVGLCGSDVHYYRHGRIGDFVVNEPMILGHESSGTIVAVGSDVDPQRMGQRVAIEPQRCCRVCAFCKKGMYNLCPHIEFYATPPIDGAFCEYQTIQADYAFEIPDDMSWDAAALLEPLSCGIAAVRKARIEPGSVVVVAGCGPIGIICALAAKAHGAGEIVMTDLVESRRAKAAELVGARTLDPASEELGENFADAFIDATGALPAVRSGIKALRGNGVAVIVGMGDEDMSLPVGTITAREISVTGIFRYTNTWPAAIELVASGQIDLDSLVTGHYGLDDVEEAIKVDTEPQTLKSVITPQK